MNPGCGIRSVLVCRDPNTIHPYTIYTASSGIMSTLNKKDEKRLNIINNTDNNLL